MKPGIAVAPAEAGAYAEHQEPSYMKRGRVF
jgi:hypothetical protein